jgi:hypothetical protein
VAAFAEASETAINLQFLLVSLNIPNKDIVYKNNM